ncbi:acetyl-CoA carboxylase biotin carboxylase subunit [Rhodococcus opacus]|jgi:acetyl-CoA carboxylase biotin carboxylase subunit|uniref:acetyl-CoA carboxylase biotin carboxylase subunit n=1 Tax=Rhodococcus opacus TaxID=37919 RepID=UPI002473F3F3|nr:acetyl-CoA carboxylase biotin carboxylase subunit [Rhodococcus opacus]MDH6286115.1 acetyl-CoA carboxylase biotin carboxylase subunit [Rhodococcus opacus]
MTDDIPVVRHDIRRVFVANRGEIAVRIIRACRHLGVETAVGVSDADVDSLAARMADEVVVLGPPQPTHSYLRADLLIRAAKRTRCDAVHPGYGFLSERASFARACRDAGLIFIGPTPESIDSMGDKITAVGLASEAGVPCVPGSGAVSDPNEALAIATEIGFPVLIKATAGGGGRGMRVVGSAAELPELFRSASSEAQSAFGDPTLYVEKFIERARHIEIQVIGDQFGNVVHLGERECSTQRRHQKLIEEAPSPVLGESEREAMGESAVRLARNVDYVGAGTVEFVVDDRDNSYYFLEMNTRIQVEHPVTEMISGRDLVAEQIRIASGLPLSFTQDEVILDGHAIECRINAEDPDRGFFPSPGLVEEWGPPSGPGVRVDTCCYSGYTVSPYYDSLLAKIIVHAPTRAEAIQKMSTALSELTVTGPTTTAPFHHSVLAHPDFAAGAVTTRWVEDTFLRQSLTEAGASA